MALFAEKVKLLKGVLTKKIPLYVQFAVSKRCDLNCRMCQAVSSRSEERELSLGEIERLADILAELNVGVLVLTGGEPLLRKDLPQIVEAFTSRSIPVRLQTNATLATERRVEALLSAGLKEVTISLDTLDPAKQDNINNTPGSWYRILRGISVFSRLLPQRGSLSGINVVVSRKNIEEIPRLVRFVSAIGFYASLIPVHLSDSGRSPGKGNFIVRAKSPDFAFAPEDFPTIDSIYQEVIRMKKKGYLIYNSFRFLKESPDFLKYRKIHWRCDSPHLYFSISPEGRFLPCVDIKTDKMILNGNFVEKYRSVGFIKEIEDMVKRCPGCMYACWPEITYMCRDPFVFAERVFQGIRVNLSKRRTFSTEEMVNLAEHIRNSS